MTYSNGIYERVTSLFYSFHFHDLALPFTAIEYGNQEFRIYYDMSVWPRKSNQLSCCFVVNLVTCVTQKHSHFYSLSSSLLFILCYHLGKFVTTIIIIHHYSTALFTVYEYIISIWNAFRMLLNGTIDYFWTVSTK